METGSDRVAGAQYVEKRRLLWVGDAACPSGFARATHEILNVVKETFDVTVLGINYRGDPHPYPYPIYSAHPGGDAIGVGRLIWMCDIVKPHVIVLQNDGWHLQYYTEKLKQFKEYKDIPVVAIVAVDGKNFQKEWLHNISLPIFWTEFALNEARLANYAGPAEVIPLGVDTTLYHPIDKLEARYRRGFPKEMDDAFVVGNVNRNQFRKRWDLTLKYFSDWLYTNAPIDKRQDSKYRIDDNAWLYLHCAPTGDTGCNVVQLSKYYGIHDRVALMEPAMFYGVAEHEMVDTYNCFDVQITTTQGEGFGLTTFEGMACGVPQIVPAWSALEELTMGTAIQVSCPSSIVGPPFVNVLGGVPDDERFVAAIGMLYRSPKHRAEIAARGLERAHELRFTWSEVGRRFNEAILVTVERAATEECLTS